MKDNEPRLKIAYYSVNDPLDKRSWSCVTFYLGQALQRNVGDVHFLGPVQFPWFIDKIQRGMAKLCRGLFKSKYYTKYGLLQNIYAAKWLKKKMTWEHYDCIIAPAAAPELGYLKTDIPVVFFGDATYRLLSQYYVWDFKNLNWFSRWEGEHLEKKAFRNCSVTIFTSKWAAQSALNDYHVPPEKVHIIPFGANMDFVPPSTDIFKKEENKKLTLLFLAVEWERKGGKYAFDTLVQLRKMGIDARLIFCGCIPPKEFSHPDMEVIPFLNKNIKEDHDRFIALLESIHFLIIPTRADCSLIVASEANSFGVPAIATNVGGVPDVVMDGVNGYCLPLEAEGEAYAKLIAEVFADKERYHQLIVSTRKRFEEGFTWDTWTERFREIYDKQIAGKNNVRVVQAMTKAEKV